LANGRIYWPTTQWAAEVKDQLLRFPGTARDDKVDACSLFGRHMNKTWAAVPAEPEKPTLAEAFAAPMQVKDMMPRPKTRQW
jgi:hypothetical protein